MRRMKEKFSFGNVNVEVKVYRYRDWTVEAKVKGPYGTHVAREILHDEKDLHMTTESVVVDALANHFGLREKASIIADKVVKLQNTSTKKTRKLSKKKLKKILENILKDYLQEIEITE